MKYSSLFLLVSILIINCSKPKCKCEIDNFIQTQNDSLLAEIKSDENYKLKKYWSRFDEPILEEQKFESFRFSITVLLYDYQKIYRINKEHDKIVLYTKEYAVPTTTGFRNDSLIKEKIKILTNEEWHEIKNSINQNCFWTLPTDVEKRVLDGSTWILEGYNPNENNCTNLNYHFAYRASPDSSNFKTVSEKIMSLDSFKLKQF